MTFPTPDGGKFRQIMVDIDPLKLQANGLTPLDVVNAVNAQNLTLPSGLQKIGDTQYTVCAPMRCPRPSPRPPMTFRSNTVNGRTVFMRDVGQVHDGWAVQQNAWSARTAGAPSCSASSRTATPRPFAVVDGVRKEVLKIAREAAPPGLQHQRAVRSIRSSSPPRSPGCSAREGIAAEAHRAHDPAVPRLVAIDRDRPGSRSPVDPDVDRRPLLPRRHAFNTMTLGGMAAFRGRYPGRRSRLVTIENTHRHLRSEGMKVSPRRRFTAPPA